MAYITIPLYSEPSYKYKTILEGTNCEIKIQWNDRSYGWYMDLSLEDGTPIFQGEKIVPHYPIAFTYNKQVDDVVLGGFFWLDHYATEENHPNFSDVARELPNHYFLSYVY